MFGPQFLQQLALGLPVLLLSLTVHEYFHAWTALKFGDDTAARMGRLSLNPLAHLDLWGTLMMVFSGFRFGWAKPVPVNPLRLRNPRVADIWVSAAGPISNMGLAVIFGLLYRLLSTGTLNIPHAVFMLLVNGVAINIALAFFNLLPLFPLDGSHILRNLLPPRYDGMMARFDQIAPLILLGLLFVGAINMYLNPIIAVLGSLILGIPA